MTPWSHPVRSTGPRRPRARSIDRARDAARLSVNERPGPWAVESWAGHLAPRIDSPFCNRSVYTQTTNTDNFLQGLTRFPPGPFYK